MEKTLFATLAEAAFPAAAQDIAGAAIEALSPFVDDKYSIDTADAACVTDAPVRIPARIRFSEPPPPQLGRNGAAQLAADCLISRSTDGYVRQAALRRILHATQPWAIPFILLPAGE
jgi:hypothetical protein